MSVLQLVCLHQVVTLLAKFRLVFTESVSSACVWSLVFTVSSLPSKYSYLCHTPVNPWNVQLTTDITVYKTHPPRMSAVFDKSYIFKGIVHSDWQFYHHLLTLVSLQTCVNFFLLQNTKEDTLENVGSFGDHWLPLCGHRNTCSKYLIESKSLQVEMT